MWRNGLRFLSFSIHIKFNIIVNMLLIMRYGIDILSVHTQNNFWSAFIFLDKTGENCKCQSVFVSFVLYDSFIISNFTYTYCWHAGLQVCWHRITVPACIWDPLNRSGIIMIVLAYMSAGIVLQSLHSVEIPLNRAENYFDCNGGDEFSYLTLDIN